MPWTDYIKTIGGVTYYILIVLVIMVVLGLLGWFIWRQIAYNKRVIIRVLTGGGGVLILTDLAKEYKDKASGAYYWKLKKRKHIFSRPVPRSISLTKKGSEWVDMFYTGQGQYIPAVTANPEFMEGSEYIKTFKPITEPQRSSYVNQIQKSFAYHKKGLSEILRDAIPYIALVLIIAVFLLFLNEGMVPIIEQAKIAAGASEDFKIAADTMREAVQALRGVQVIGMKPDLNVSTLPN